MRTGPPMLVTLETVLWAMVRLVMTSCSSVDDCCDATRRIVAHAGVFDADISERRPVHSWISLIPAVTAIGPMDDVVGNGVVHHARS